MARTTPARLRLDSIIPRPAPRLIDQGATGMRRTAWSRKTHPPCSAALAVVRRHVWDHLQGATSHHETDMMQLPRVWLERFTEALCYAAYVDKVTLTREALKFRHRYRDAPGPSEP